MNVGCIVEGHGEVQALPVLLRRMIAELRIDTTLEIVHVHRVTRMRVVLPGELERALDIVTSRVGRHGRILILLDAERDCPKALAPHLLERVRRARPDMRAAVVLAALEFENWFLAALGSLGGVRGLPTKLNDIPEPESVRGAKERLRVLSNQNYTPKIDQAALAARIHLGSARKAPSFDKLCREVVHLLAP